MKNQSSTSADKIVAPDLSIDLRKWAFKLLSYWWLFLICLAISVGSGYLYLRYATFEYEAKAKLLIKGTGGGNGLSELSILSENLGIQQGNKQLNDEMEILASRPIVLKAIEKTRGNITYTLQGQFKNTETYKDTPFILSEFELKDARKFLSFFVRVGYYDTFEFGSGEEINETYSYGQSIENKFGTFLIQKRKDAKLVPGLYHVSIMPKESVAESYKRKLNIEIVGSQNTSSIIELKLQDRSAEKAVDFISAIIDSYNESEIEDEGATLSSTLDFIDKRVTILSDELNQVETEIEEFKSNNEIITSDATSSLGFALTELRSSLAKLSIYQIERQLLIAVKQDLSNSNTLIPVNIANASENLSSLIDQYNDKFLERKRLKENITDQSPVIMNLNSDLDDLRSLIIVSLDNVIDNLDVPINQAEEEIKQLKMDLTEVPSVERKLLEKLRMQSIKESLFLFLLQKREETELSLAIITPNTRVIEGARTSGYPVYPQKRIIQLGTIILGILIPVGLIFIISLFENSIDSEDILKGITTIPIIGRIPIIKSDDKVIATKMTNSVSIESFRLLRTNLNYMNLNNDKLVVMTTSSMSGEGKSIISINLALTIAQAQKKVVLIDLDLRKPKIATYLDGGFSSGVSNYLAGQEELSSIINKHESVKDFAFITSGPKPPNPAEMIQSDRMKNMIDELKKEFDYIIIDSPPMGLVADSLLLRKYVTNTLYVVRHKYTKKVMLKHLEELHQNGELVKPSIVFNDVKVSKGDYGYGGYNSSYGSGYYTENS